MDLQTNTENDSSDSTESAATKNEDSHKEELGRLFDEMSAAAEEDSGSPSGTNPPTTNDPADPPAGVSDESVSEGEPESSNTLQAPEHWSADKREEFDKLPPEAQQLLLDRSTELERGANEKFQQAAQSRKVAERFEEMVAPFRQGWALQGIDEYQGVSQLLAYSKALNENPAGLIKFLAQQSGVDLATLAPQSDPDAAYVDPEIAAMRQELAQTRAQVQAMQTGQAVNSGQAQLAAFMDAKTPEGKPLHPHMDKVIGDMVTLAQGIRASGQVPQLAEIYTKAVKMNGLETAKPTVDQLKEQREKAARARSAGTTIRSTTPATPAKPTGPRSLKEELSDGYDEMLKR